MDTNEQAVATGAPPQPKYSCFDLSFDGAVAHLKMLRGKQHNSMTREFWSELPQAIDEVENNESARVLVISADGPSFSSGMDLSVFQNPQNLANDTAIRRERLRRLVLHLQGVFNRLEKCRVPVLAAIQGPCIGAAFDLVCACDLRYATNSAYFTIHEISLGMMADLGTLQRLPHLIPEGVARELALTGDKLSAQRALAFGLVSEVLADNDSLLAHVLSVAKRISERSPLAVSGTREALRYARSHSVEEGLEMCATLQSAIFEGSDVMRAVKAQKSGTCPQFSNLESKNIQL